MFLVIRGMNRMKKQTPAPTIKECPFCTSQLS